MNLFNKVGLKQLLKVDLDFLVQRKNAAPVDVKWWMLYLQIWIYSP